MKIISLVSFKGGVGKTTTLQMLSSALLARGHRVALIESDDNVPLNQWRENARQQGTWDEALDIFPAGSAGAVIEAMEAAEAAGVDYLLVDTHGGGSDLNNAVITNSSLVIVPTAITSADLPRTIETLAYLTKVRKTEGLDGSLVLAILITRLPLVVNKSRQDEIDALSRLPVFQTHVRDRDALARMERTGLLHLTLAQREASGSKVSATHFRTAMRETLELGDEVLTIVERAS